MKQIINTSIQKTLSHNSSLKVNKETACLGLQKGWTRVTFIIKEEHTQKIKMHAKHNKITMKKVLNIILTNFLSCRTINPIPQKHRNID